MNKSELIALTLWWAEGTKSRRDKRWKRAVSYPIEITNTNPAIIKIFLGYLRSNLRIHENKIKVQIQVHDGDKVSELENYWAEVTGVPKANFNKTIIRPTGRKIGKSKGTCKVRFADKETYKELESRLRTALEGVYDQPHEILRVYEPGHTEVNLLK